MTNAENTKLKNWHRAVAWTLLAGAISASGCASMPLFSRKTPDVDSDLSIANVLSPTERGLRRVAYEKGQAQGGSDADLEKARARYDQAKQFFDQGDYSTAEKEFKEIVADRRKKLGTNSSWVEKLSGTGTKSLAYENFGDPVEEDALFMLAECQFARQRYTKAQDSYDDLLNRYPSTYHMDRVTKQLFRMARYWLNFPNDLQQRQESGIQLVSSEETDNVPAAPGQGTDSRALPFLPNLTDKTRPIYDADGRGLQALRSIWLHDATGPLADNALMLSANHNLRIQNFLESKRLYDLLREQYPDSPHIKDAYLLGSAVTLASYEGPEYDGKPLDQARDLKQTMIQIFPDLTPEERQRLQTEIDEMHVAEVERIWENVVFYQRKGTPEAIALYCNVLINRYPNSEYAVRARAVLQQLQSRSRQPERSYWPWGDGKQQATAAPRPIPPQEQPTNPKTSTNPDSMNSSPDDDSGKRSLFNFLKKADEPPRLESPPPGRATL